MRNSKLRISAEKKIILPELNRVFWGGNALPVFGELHVRVKKSSGVAGLTRSHDNCTLCSLTHLV